MRIPPASSYIPYTEIPPTAPDAPLYEEHETYRREVGRLLAEGHEGKFIVIHGREIIGIFETHQEAFKAAWTLHPAQCMRREILSREPGYRLSSRVLWPSLSQLRPTG